MLEKAEALFRRALKGEEILGLDHKFILVTIYDLVEVLFLLDKFEEVESLYRRLLEHCEELLGPDHLDTLSAISDLGGVMFRQGMLEKAEALFRRALTGREKILGPNHK